MPQQQEIIHVTSPEFAVEIAKSGIFYCKDMAADSGLNCLLSIDGKRRADRGDGGNFENVGAKMTFIWTGPVSVTPPNFKPDQAAIDTLWDDVTRGFIPKGSTQHLNLVRIDLTDSGKWTPEAEEIATKVAKNPVAIIVKCVSDKPLPPKEKGIFEKFKIWLMGLLPDR